MTKLYAYDFDKTLVPYDSYNRYLKHLMWLRPVTIGLLVILRKMSFISSRALKRDVTYIVEHSPLLRKDARRFASRIMYDVSLPRSADKDVRVVILSASPRVYMHHVASMLQCQILCSDYIDGVYTEMYGETKAQYLHTHYPHTEYQYAYALSDSEADMCWMKEFEKYEKIGD